VETVKTESETAEGSFRDREHAGRLLARELAACQLEDPLVMAIPRGGIPVAAVVARSGLGARS
jgi:predicted phosphoribosyltransferase